jgi:hypothetical protein
MLQRGTTKLGRTIWHFSIPPVDTCPGKSELCERICYARRGWFGVSSSRRVLEANYLESQRADFPSLMLGAIWTQRPKLIRIHCAGDFYSARYVRKWCRIVQELPDVRFYYYTRSWRVATIAEAMRELEGFRNVAPWWSVDQETGVPPRRGVSSRVRFAYVSITDDDIAPRPVDLYFRDYNLRRHVTKKVSGELVCPQENGITSVNCLQCQVCLRTTQEMRTGHRIPLALTTVS